MTEKVLSSTEKVPRNTKGTPNTKIYFQEKVLRKTEKVHLVAQKWYTQQHRKGTLSTENVLRITEKVILTQKRYF